VNHTAIKTTIKHFVLLFVSLFVLAACGGSSGSNEVTTTPTIGAKLTASVVNGQGQAVSSAQATSAVVISVIARNDFGNTVSGVTIAFTTDLGTLSQATALTDSSGTARINLATTSSDLGVATIDISGSVDSKALTTSGQVTITALSTDVVVISIFDESCTTIITTATAGATVCLQANVSNSGALVVGTQVDFSASQGTLRPAASLTNANGLAQTLLDSDLSTLGATSITAVTSTGSTSSNFQFTEVVTNTPSLNLQVLDETCTTPVNSISAGSTLCLRAQLQLDNQPQSGEVISFNTTLGTLRQSTKLTDSDGFAAVLVDSNVDLLGVAIATATLNNDNAVSSTSNYEYTESTTGPQTPTLTLTLLDGNCTDAINSQQVSNSFCLKAQLLQNNQPVENEIISFSAALGSLRQSNGLTDRFGIATTYIDSSSTDLGAATATATFNSLSANANYQFTQSDPQQQVVLSLSILDANCQLAVTTTIAGQSLCIKATLQQGNAPLPNTIVEFSATLGTLSQPSALTSSNGTATVLLQSTSTDLGAATVIAATSGLSASKNYELTSDLVGWSLSLTSYSVDCTTEQSSFNAGSTLCLSATLNDGTNPIANEIVAFTAPLGTAQQQTALTNSVGVARILVDSASTLLGAGAATATYQVLSASTNYEYISSDVGQTVGPTLILLSLQNGEVKNRFKVGESIQLQATLTNASNQPLSETIIRYTAERGTLTTNSALTNNSGQAQVTLSANASDIGAALSTAQVTIEGVTYTQSYNYEVLAADSVELDTARIGFFDDQNNFVNGEIGVSIALNDDGEYELSAGGTMGLSVVIVDQNDARITSPTPVTFSSSCAANERTNLDTQVTTINGVATSTYEDISCATVDGNSDTLVASITVNNVSLSATRDIKLAPEEVGSIEFISAEPISIVLKGTGGQGKQETSTLTFSVKGVLGNPLTQQEVTFSLDTTVGGLTVSPMKSLTNSQGLVTTKVTSGNVPAAVRVTATTVVNEQDNIVIQTQSDLLSVNTGLPDQNSITIATATSNPEAHSFTGVEVNLRAFMADSFNNPVPDGTTINFTTEGGFIEPSCNTTNGSCVVQWTGANPRVPNHRITVLATAIGHETFFDTNGNNVFDDNDGLPISDDTDSGLNRSNYAASGFIDHSEAWRDDNENRVKDAGETFIDYNNDENFNSADGVFNGPHCTHATLCASEAGSKINVRKALVMIMSGSNVAYTLMTRNLTADSNLALEHINTNYVITTNDNGSNVQTDGGITVNAGGSSTRTDGVIELDEGFSLPLTLAIADDASGLGQILPAGTQVSISTSFGSVSGATSFVIPNSVGYLNADGSDQYGGSFAFFSLTNTNSTTNAGDTTQGGTLTIDFIFPSSLAFSSFSVPFVMLGQ
jgi:hypothetical protein